MKIAEMNNCIEKMREIYKFDDENTEIALGEYRECRGNRVRLYTKDDNGTEISLARDVDSIVDFPSLKDEELQEDD